MLNKEQRREGLIKVRSDLAEQFIKLRQEKGWTQLEVAEAINLCLGMVQKIEMGKFWSIDTIIYFASFYDKKIVISLV